MAREFDDFGAERLNDEECERAGAVLRAALGAAADGCMPTILEMLELARNNVPEANRLDVVVLPDESMGDSRAFAKAELQEIYVGQTFYESAIRDDPDARFDGTHELVHVIFHKGAPRYFRKASGNIIYPFLPDKHKTAEWQADRIARAILMPPGMVRNCKDALDLAERARVPLKQAAIRIHELDADKPRSTPKDIALKIANLAINSTTGISSAKRQAELTKLELWNALPVIEGECPNKSRKCGPYRILWNEFGKTTQCGWYIENGAIVSTFAMRSR